MALLFGTTFCVTFENTKLAVLQLSQANDLCPRLFFGSSIVGLFVFSKLSEDPSHIRSITELDISVPFSTWAAQSFHNLALCESRGFFVFLYLHLWMVHDSRNARDSPTSPVAPVLQVTLLRTWGMCLQLPSHPCKNVRSVPLHGTLLAVESRCVDCIAFQVLCTLS